MLRMASLLFLLSTKLIVKPRRWFSASLCIKWWHNHSLQSPATLTGKSGDSSIVFHHEKKSHMHTQISHLSPSTNTLLPRILIFLYLLHPLFKNDKIMTWFQRVLLIKKECLVKGLWFMTEYKLCMRKSLKLFSVCFFQVVDDVEKLSLGAIRTLPGIVDNNGLAASHVSI